MNLAMKWIDDLRGTDSIREVARKSGIAQPTLARQINNGQLTFESVRDVSRAYGRAVLADLITLGHLSESDAGIEGIERALSAATDEQLVVEVGKRLDVTPSSMVWDAPASEAIERAENVSGTGKDAIVTPFNPIGADLTAAEADELLKNHRYAADKRDGRDEEAEADPHP